METSELRNLFLQGLAIPALPLALDQNRAWDQRHQRALIRYYLDAGVGGIAVGVHSTQFEIREPQHALF
jgi:O-succinylbenzoate synthase